RDALDEGATVEASKGVVRGYSAGAAIEIRFVTRGSGSYSESWTEVEAAVDTRGLLLALRRQTPEEESLVREGLAVDLQTGDDVFDHAFVVEAAPADVVLALLTPEIREGLLALRNVALRTGEAGVRLEQPAWVKDGARLRAMAVLAAKVALGVPAARASVDLVTAGYRGPARGGDGRPQREVEALRKIQAAREMALARRGCASAALIFLVAIAFSALVALLRAR
ncbi:MAG TPA: hypothetical protein VFS00_10070, partial [Polyangiaceae bacterium]|nr:hypothetical protein [Polyangiaceae bacterium]